MIFADVGHIRERVAAACARAGRNPADVTLVAVSKTFPVDRIREVVAAGVHDVGENYVQELLTKKNDLGNKDIRWHFVGHLQSNKVKHIVGWIHLLHSLDTVRVAQEINRRAAEAGRTVDVLVEVNTTGENTKCGVRPDETLEFIKRLGGYDHIRITGLMTMGPLDPDPERARPMFRVLRSLRDRAATLSQNNVAMHHLSMGMTGDFEVAIEEGATLVRLGTALFGPRVRKQAGEMV